MNKIRCLLSNFQWQFLFLVLFSFKQL